MLRNLSQILKVVFAQVLTWERHVLLVF
jgi:hypothetical protein